jgi:hypothetical protein
MLLHVLCAALRQEVDLPTDQQQINTACAEPRS